MQNNDKCVKKDFNVNQSFDINCDENINLDLELEEPFNVFDTDQFLDNECLSNLNDVLKDNLILSEKVAAAAFLAIFFHLKLTQKAFKVISAFINIMCSCKIPNSFDKCAKILFKDTKDKSDYKKKWFCQLCKKETSLQNQYQRHCKNCKTR